MKRKTLWKFENLATGKVEFIHAGSQRSASDKLKQAGIKFRDLAKCKETIAPPP